MSEERHPFERIALSLSGGGTRAVGFHLGSMSYLDRIGLLEKVRMLSTVSGGSAVGMGYAVYSKTPQDGERPLKTLYRELRESLPRDPAQLVGLLQKAYDKQPAAPSGRRTLIANMAELYNHLFSFCDDKRFDLFWGDQPIHLEDIVFNATEFLTGVGFRFYKSVDDRSSGSEFAILDPKYARQARLCDILAASTCIPVGFEPIEFPDDFRWPDDTAAVPKNRRTCEEICRELPENPTKPDSKRSITLMDGGIYDNQGVFSILNILGLTYDSRRDREKKGDGYVPRDINLAGMFGGGGRQEPAEHRADDIDLFIASDTPARDIPIYEMAEKPENGGFLDLEKLKWIVSITLLLLTASTLFMGYDYFSTLLSDSSRLKNWQYYIWDMFIYVIPLLLLLVCVGGGLFLSGRIKNYFDSSPTFRNNPDLRPKLWHFFKRRKFSDLGYMFESRLSSAIAMSSDVFMNRIRFLGLARIFNLPPLKGKVIINVIDSLIRDKRTLQAAAANSEEQNESIAKLLDGADMLCDDTVYKASKVGTQFWLATEDMADLLACGQATMCYNLLRQMDQMKKDGHAGTKNEQFEKIYQQAATDWEKLKANPYYLMDDPYRDLKKTTQEIC
jgi:predicted acylesterase/phospholipase RssA